MREWYIYPHDERDQVMEINEASPSDGAIRVIEYSEYEKLKKIVEEIATYEEWQHAKGKPSLWEIQARAIKSL